MDEAQVVLGTVAILAQGTHTAPCNLQAFLFPPESLGAYRLSFFRLGALERQGLREKRPCLGY